MTLNELYIYKKFIQNNKTEKQQKTQKQKIKRGTPKV